MRKQFWFLLVLVVIALIAMGAYGLSRWLGGKAPTLPEDDRIPVAQAPRPELMDGDGNPRGLGREEMAGAMDYMLTDEYAALSAEDKQAYREALADAYNASAPELALLGGSDLLDPSSEEYTEQQRTFLEEEVAEVHDIADERAGDQESHMGGEFIDNFLAMSREEQNEMLDGWIDYMDEHRTQIHQWRNSRPRPEQATEYPTRFQRRMSYQDPLGRAKMGELMNRFEQRCEERGIRPVRVF